MHTQQPEKQYRIKVPHAEWAQARAIIAQLHPNKTYHDYIIEAIKEKNRRDAKRMK